MSDGLCILRLASRCRTDEEPDPGPKPRRYGYLCGSCFMRVEKTIAEAPALLDDLALVLRRQGQALGERVDGTGDEPTFISGLVADARTDLFAKFCSWASVVVEECSLHAPEVTPEGVAAFLVTHLRWLAEQPWVDEMARELDAATRSAKSLAYPSGERHITLKDPDGEPIHCVESFCSIVATHEALPCEGVLEAVVRDVDALLPSQITCSECCVQIPSSRWHAFGGRYLKRKAA